MDLLAAVEAAAAQAPWAQMLRGRVAIGVRSGERDRWLVLDPSATPVARPCEGPPSPDAEAKLLMGEAEAAALLTGAPLPTPALLRKQGDEALIEALLDRCFSIHSTVSIRSWDANR